MRPLVKFAVTAAVVAAILFTAAARQATGRELAIDGDLVLGLFPQPHVRVGAARLLNPQGFDGAVVEFTSARANVQLQPLVCTLAIIRRYVGRRLALRQAATHVRGSRILSRACLRFQPCRLKDCT